MENMHMFFTQKNGIILPRILGSKDIRNMLFSEVAVQLELNGKIYADSEKDTIIVNQRQAI